MPRLLANADMGPAEVHEYCRLHDAGKSPLRASMSQVGMSARACRRTLKLGRAIAARGGAAGIKTHRLAEAM
jgi:magnesium chelatase family protein